MPKKVFGPHPINSPIGPQKAQNNPKKAKNKKVRKQTSEWKMRDFKVGVPTLNHNGKNDKIYMHLSVVRKKSELDCV